MTQGKRVAARAAIATALAGLSALGVALTDGAISPVEIVSIATATVGALGVYLGIGASTAVEPSLGVKE